MAYQKEMALLIIKVTEDGYYLDGWKWPRQPPSGGDNLQSFVDKIPAQHDPPNGLIRQSRVSTTKAGLEADVDLLINTLDGPV